MTISNVIVWIIWMNVMYFMNDFIAFDKGYETGKKQYLLLFDIK